MNEAPVPGMWITQNLIANQGSYFIMRVHSVDDERVVHFDLKFEFTQLSARQTPALYCKGYDWDPTGDIFPIHKNLLSKSMFQSMKRPRPEMRKGMIRAIIEGKRR